MKRKIIFLKGIKDNMDKKELVSRCAEMFERYYDRLSGKNDSHRVYSLDTEDMKLWKTVYFVELQKYPDICDADFFRPADQDKHPEYGVGTDGEFVLYEYCNIRYQLYRCMVLEQLKVMGMTSLPMGQMGEIEELLKILESYVPQFMHKGTRDSQLVSFCDEHKKIWDKFYALNRNEELIPDGTFFGNIQSNPNYGIGKDGSFFGVELLHFLGNCYKIISQALGLL